MKKIAEQLEEIHVQLFCLVYYFVCINIYIICTFCFECSLYHLPILSLAVLMGLLAYCISLLVTIIRAIRGIAKVTDPDVFVKIVSIFFLLPYNNVFYAAIVSIVTGDYKPLYDTQERLFIPLVFPFYYLLMKVVKALMKGVKEKN